MKTTRSIKALLLLLLLGACAPGLKNTPSRIKIPKAPEIQFVDVRRCLPEGQGKEVCVPEGSEWRFVKIKTVLLNNEALRYYIELLKAAPCWEKEDKQIKLAR